MKITKQIIVKVIVLMSIILCSMTVYGTDARFTQSAQTKAVTKSAESTTSQTITFEEDEYVRLAQSINEGGTTTVSGSQINIQGQAREGTKITIKVYLSTTQKGNMISNKLPVVYNLATVGKLQDFNQLIDLGEGYNTVWLSYTNENTKDVYGEKKFVIERLPQETQDALKTHLVTSESILDKIGK